MNPPFNEESQMLIDYVKRFGKKTQEQAIEHLDRYCGDWRNTPIPQARQIESIASDEKEWEE
ncbi:MULTISPECIES: hypothetical protein [Vibrio]|uniref:Uncharacterized protein n=2 Tax=Vibrio mimicus TaxID=674 RepID=A0A2J9VKJ0_VIBMI|nr:MULTISPECIES: hypothetical protein [Vibrio]EGR1111426.1 hypothetical protein [Vibrio cholerae]EJL6708077.1 hypothetical protein [Vibrio cholerae]ELB7341432.1 hypothetical protein [Vibrio cholerae]ELC9567485.1 hypothetical protein [Vibrio cholerae]ELK8282273.1 hypothetical protein [Vibrio cholerae]